MLRCMRWNLAAPNIRVPEGIQYFSERKALRIHTRNLPHWRQEGVTYFVTFRQKDSIPKAVWEAMKTEAVAWNQRIDDHVREHGEISTSMAADWEAFQRRQWIQAERIADECQGSCVLADAEVRQMMVDALMFFEGSRQVMHALVVMPNHVHALVTPLPGWTLEKLTQSWKGFTSRTINGYLGREGPLWQEESFDRIVRNEEHFERVVKYIVANPVKARVGVDRSTVGVSKTCAGGEEALREEPPLMEGDEW